VCAIRNYSSSTGPRPLVVDASKINIPAPEEIVAIDAKDMLPMDLNKYVCEVLGLKKLNSNDFTYTSKRFLSRNGLQREYHAAAFSVKLPADEKTGKSKMLKWFPKVGELSNFVDGYRDEYVDCPDDGRRYFRNQSEARSNLFMSFVLFKSNHTATEFINHCLSKIKVEKDPNFF